MCPQCDEYIEEADEITEHYCPDCKLKFGVDIPYEPNEDYLLDYGDMKYHQMKDDGDL